MISIHEAKGAIFDVDETLLDSGTGRHTQMKSALHERARRQAFHETGKRHGMPAFIALTAEENLQGFFDAPVHSMEGATWHIMYLKGVVATEEIEPDNPLLQEIVVRKDELFESILRDEGKPIPGAVEFVAWTADIGLRDHLAVASSAIRRDINIFFETSKLASYFPSKRIISKEDITYTKPHPEAFDKAFLTLGLPESDRGKVLAFEDNPRGIMSAKGAGLFTCAITTVHTKEELQSLAVPPDLIADSYKEFRQLLA